MKLLPMTDYVLSSLEYHTIKDYAELLKQPLKLEMFLPCDDDGNLLGDPPEMEVLGRSQGGSKRGEAKLPRWISANNLTPYISNDLRKAILEPIVYKTTYKTNS